MITLYDPNVTEVKKRTALFEPGNHEAMITAIELLDEETNQFGEVYQNLQIQWAHEDVQIRQKMIAIHNGEDKRAGGAMMATARRLGEIAVAVNHEGPLVLDPETGDTSELMGAIGNKLCGIAVRENSGGYVEVDTVAQSVKALPAFKEKKQSSGVPMEDQLAAILNGANG